MKKLKSNIVIITIFLIISILILMQSPLNPIHGNIAKSDSTVFIYCGNAIRDGKIIYKDVFDHKGPILYLIEVIGLSITNGNTVGIWLIEVLFMLSNLCLLYKISKLFSNNKIINVLASIISLIPILEFLNKGNFTEEYALPFIIYALYVFIKYLKNNYVRYIEIFLNAVCMGIVLMLRPNMIAVWIVFIPVMIFLYIRDKKFKELGKTVLIYLGGILTVLLPIILYFVVNNAISDFLYCFIEFNFKYTKFQGQDEGVVKTLISFFNHTKFNVLCVIILIANVVRLGRKKQKYFEQIIYIVYFIVTLILISVSGQKYLHYAMILIPFYIVPITQIMEFLLNIENKKIKIFSYVIYGLLIVLISIKSINHQVNEIKKLYTKEEKVEEIVSWIKENTEKDDNVLILMNDCMIYNYSERKYDGKYIYQTPIFAVDRKLVEELMIEIEENKPKIIVFPDIYSTFESMKNYDKFLEKSKEKLPEAFEYEETRKMMEDSANLFIDRVKNLGDMCKKIAELEEKGFYTKVINEKYTIWTLNE